MTSSSQNAGEQSMGLLFLRPQSGHYFTIDGLIYQTDRQFNFPKYINLGYGPRQKMHNNLQSGCKTIRIQTQPAI